MSLCGIVTLLRALLRAKRILGVKSTALSTRFCKYQITVTYLSLQTYSLIIAHRSAISQWDDNCAVQLALILSNLIKHNCGSTVWVKCLGLSCTAKKREGSLPAALGRRHITAVIQYYNLPDIDSLTVPAGANISNTRVPPVDTNNHHGSGLAVTVKVCS